jgi:hypothetical protein
VRIALPLLHAQGCAVLGRTRLVARGQCGSGHSDATGTGTGGCLQAVNQDAYAGQEKGMVAEMHTQPHLGSALDAN